MTKDKLLTVTELVKEETKLEKGSGTPDKEKIANLSIEQIIKIAIFSLSGVPEPFSNLVSSLTNSVTVNNLSLVIFLNLFFFFSSYNFDRIHLYCNWNWNS